MDHTSSIANYSYGMMGLCVLKGLEYWRNLLQSKTEIICIWMPYVLYRESTQAEEYTISAVKSLNVVVVSQWL